MRAPSQEYDLGNDGSISLSIANFEAGQIRETLYKYKTNSTKIKVSMTSEVSISVKVALYDASNNPQLQQTTVTVGTLFYKTVTFSNLSSAKRYYMRFENLGQQEVNIHRLHLSITRHKCLPVSNKRRERGVYLPRSRFTRFRSPHRHAFHRLCGKRTCVFQ